MEQDLREAYAALKLLRSELVKTRRDKRSLEDSITQWQMHGPPLTPESRETQQMQLEDSNAQLWRVVNQYDKRLAEMEKIISDNKCQKNKNPLLIRESTRPMDEEEQMEKATVLDKLHSLTATVEQQTQTILTQQATFLLQKRELKTMLMEAQHMLQTEKSKVADAVLQQQVMKEKFEFLETQVDMLKEEKLKLEKEKTQMEMTVAAHAQTGSLLKQQLKEKEEEIMNWNSQEQSQFDQKTNELVKEVSGRFQREIEVKEKKIYVKHQQEILELQRKMELLKSELNREKAKKLQDEDDMRKRHVEAFGELKQLHCVELKAKIAEYELKQAADEKKHEEILKETEEQYATTVNILEMKLVDAHKQLAESEAARSTETKEYDKNLGDALKRLQDQREDRDQHLVTLRKLHIDLKETQTQLEMSETKLADEVKNNQEQMKGVLQQLHDQQHDKERHAMTLRDLQSKLSEAQLQLDDSEANHLAQLKEYKEIRMEASQLAAQHENTTRTLNSEKKALQEEKREARHTLELMNEELLTCQSVCEEKIQEHMRRMCKVQAQCESLESQLLSGEDHREPFRVTKSVKELSTVEAFGGRTDDEITAMSLWRSWALLGSGIKEISDFLPQLQNVLGAMNDALKLCETHADALPVLCERLQLKVASEKEQPPILSIALCLVRFVGMLKAQTQREAITVTADFVQSFRNHVLDALAQWYECDSGDNDQGEKRIMPTPTFTTTSRETALILQNWTNERKKQLGVRRWLARMEAYPGVPPLRGPSSNRVLELPPEGCTLELDDMTSEVKDAFLLLVIPILKQNRALHVRVFIRYVCNYETKLKQLRGDEEVGLEKAWNMRIHVQSTILQSRPASLKLSPSSRGSLRSLVPSSPASSVSSSTSSTASSRLQIIQERLHYLHHNV